MAAGSEIIPGFTRIPPPKPGVPPTEAEIVGLEGILTPPPFEVPEDEEQADTGFSRIEDHTGRVIPLLGAVEAPGMLERLREYMGMGIGRKETGPLELEAATRRLAGEEDASAFEVREEVFGTGKEVEFNRVFARGISGVTGGISDMLQGYAEHPETFPGALLGAGAHFIGFMLGPFKLARGITGSRLAPTSSGLKRVAEIMAQGGATLGMATGLSSIAPALMQSDTLTEAFTETRNSALMGALIGAIYPAMGAVENPVLRVAMTLAVIDKIRAGPSQWFAIDDVVRGVRDGTIDKQELGEAAFGYMMDIYFSLKVPSMRKQLAAFDNVAFREVSRLDVQKVEDTLVEMGRRGDLVTELEEGVSKRDIERAFGSLEKFEQAFQRVSEPKTTEALKHEAAEIEARTIADALEQAAAREGEQTLIQAVKEQGGIQPSRAFSKEVQKEIQLRTPGIVRKQAPMQMDQMAEFLRRERPQFGIETAAELEEALRGRLPSQRTLAQEARRGDFESLFPEILEIEASPSQIVTAIRKDKTNKLYIEIINRLKEGMSTEDVRFLAEEGGQRGKEGEARFMEAIEELATEEGIELPEILPPARPPPGPPTAPPGGPPPESLGPARKVEAMFNRADIELQALRKLTFKKVRQEMARATLDISSEVKQRLLKDAGDLGREAVIRKDLIKGMGLKSSERSLEAEKEISEGLSKVEDKVLENVIQAERTITIDKHRRMILAFEQERLRTLVPEFMKAEQTEILKEAEELIRHPEGLTGVDHQHYLDVLKNSDPAMLERLQKARAIYSAAHRKNLVALRDAGLITEKAFQHLDAVGDYSPRRFIQHIDPVRTRTGAGGKVISVQDSGLKFLDTGSYRVMEKNWRLLLRQSIAITNSRIANNQANEAAWAVATQVPEQEIFKPRRKGPLPAGMEEISVMLRGVEHKMEMPQELHKLWVTSDPAIRSDLANFFGWISGSKILKPMATGLNPEFALTNFPKDLVHGWLTTHEYSPNPFKFAKQMGSDLKATRADAFNRTGAYVDAINEGLGMSWMTQQGAVTSKLTGKMADLQKVAGYMGETSEIWVRLAIRHRALLNGKPPHEATWIARSYLDFDQGGWAIKGLDTGIPYLSAGVQATRGIGRAVKEAPGETLGKLAWLGSMAAGLYIANRVINKEALDAIPMRQKVNNYVFTTPLSFLDDEGNERWLYFTIAKDQSQRPISTLFEAMIQKAIGDPVDGDQIVASIQDALPIMPTQNFPPTFNAILGYAANVDFWNRDDVWRGEELKDPREEWTNFTHPGLKEFGALTNLSPERTGFVLEQFFTHGNIYTSVVGAGTEALMKAAGKDVRHKTTLDMLVSVPFMRRVLRATDPFEPDRKMVEDIKLEDNQARFIKKRDLDKLSEEFYRAKKEGKNVQVLEDGIRRFIGTAREDMQDMLFQRFKFFGEVFELPNRRFWLSIRALSPEARALAFWTKFMQTPEKKRIAMMEQAAALPGIVSKRFNKQWTKLIQSSKKGKLLPTKFEEEWDAVITVEKAVR